MDVKDFQIQQRHEIKCDANGATLGPDGPHLNWAKLNIIYRWILRFACWVASKIINTGLSQRHTEQSDVQNDDKSIESMNTAVDTTWQNQCSILKRMHSSGLIDCIRFSINMINSIHYAVSGSNEIPKKGISLLDYLNKSHVLSSRNYVRFYISSNDRKDRFKIELHRGQPFNVFCDISQNKDVSYNICGDVKIFPISGNDQELTMSYKVYEISEFGKPFMREKTCTINKADLIWKEHPKISYLEEHNIPTANLGELCAAITMDNQKNTKIKNADREYYFYIEDGRVFLGDYINLDNNCPNTCYCTRNIKLTEDNNDQENVKIEGEYCSEKEGWKKFSGKIKKDELKNYAISIPASKSHDFLQEKKMLPEEGKVTIVDVENSSDKTEKDNDARAITKIKIDHDENFYAQLSGADVWYDLNDVHLSVKSDNKQLNIEFEYFPADSWYKNSIAVNIEKPQQMNVDSDEATGKRDFLKYLKEEIFPDQNSACNFSFNIRNANPPEIKSIQVAEGNAIRIGWGNNPDSFVEAQNVKIKRTDLKSGIITGTYGDQSDIRQFSCEVNLHDMRIQQVLSNAPKVKVDDKGQINFNESSKGMELDEFLKRLNLILEWNDDGVITLPVKGQVNEEMYYFKIGRNRSDSNTYYCLSQATDFNEKEDKKWITLQDLQIFAIESDPDHAIIKAQWADDSNSSQIHEESFYVNTRIFYTRSFWR